MEQEWTKQRLQEAMPELSGIAYEVTSDADKRYNCAGWAVGTKKWWDVNRYWPLPDRTDATIRGYQRSFETLGFVECSTPELEPEYEKIALYEYNGYFAHAARQLPNGAWTSKLGNFQDIEHATHDALNGLPDYGRAVAFMRRPRP